MVNYILMQYIFITRRPIKSDGRKLYLSLSRIRTLEYSCMFGRPFLIVEYTRDTR
jgi:hypothetical protein